MFRGRDLSMLLALCSREAQGTFSSAFPPVSWQAAEEKLAESHIPPELSMSLRKESVYVYHPRSSSKTSYKAHRKQK